MGLDPKQIKRSVKLPKTRFGMKANLAQLEPGIRKRWDKARIYDEIRRARGGSPLYVMHDGPPYASGELHIGTGMNKILKDVVCKYKTMRGFDVPFVPGWDCHGLPIEHKVLQEMRQKGADWPVHVIRKRSEAFARKHLKGHVKQFQALGVFGRFQAPYLTLSPRYEAGVLSVFEALVAGGYISRQRKPIHWCAEDATALAEAEVEYKDRSDPSITCRFPADLSSVFGEQGEAAGLLVWTTTPWTLLANVAVAVHPRSLYRLVRYRRSGARETSVLAAPLQDAVLGTLEASDPEVLAEVKGEALEGARYRRPFPQLVGAQGPVVTALYVSMTDGTGLVHTAPGHGQDDYQTGVRLGLEVVSPVDRHGCYDDTAPPEHRGRFVLDQNEAIVQDLEARGILRSHQEIQHSYPHCWRCKGPLLFRATPQWFVTVDHAGLRERALKAIRDDVRWVPAWGQTRIESMVQDRPDWCISRQRTWGIPIPAFFCDACGEPLLTAESVARVRAVVAERGANAWFERTVEDLLGEGFSCGACGHEAFRKENDIFDVWFESGSSWRSVCEAEPELRVPADLYLEGTDQHRGWFQLSLLPAIAATGEAPYRTVVTHGFVVDETGQKMSKSLGNYISLADGLREFSGDILRLWFTSIDYTGDIKVSRGLIDGMRDVYRKIRNTFRFLLGNLDGFSGPTRIGEGSAAPDEIDRWALWELERMRAACEEAYEGFRFHRVYRLVHDFCVVTLSSSYFEMVRDRLYCDPVDSAARRGTQQVLYRILTTLARLVAPILVYTSEEVWDHVRAIAERAGDAVATSVHLAPWPAPVAPDAIGDGAGLERRWAVLGRLRDDVRRAVEALRRTGAVGSGTDVALSLFWDAESTVGQVLAAAAKMLGGWALERVLGVGELEVAHGADGLDAGTELPAARLRVARSEHGKCQRCWLLRSDVEDGLCARCAGVLGVRPAKRIAEG